MERIALAILSRISKRSEAFIRAEHPFRGLISITELIVESTVFELELQSCSSIGTFSKRLFPVAFATLSPKEHPVASTV